MTRVFLVILFISFSFRTGFAQQTRFTAGIEAGPSLICLKEKWNSYFLNPGVGFSASIFLQYNTKQIFSLKLAPGIEGKGNWESNPFHLDYFIVPLLFRAEYGSKVRGFISVGPFGGYLISACATADYFDGKVDYMKYLKKFDAGISTGLGISVTLLSELSLSIELRNNFGLIQIVIPEEVQKTGWNWKTYSTNLLISFSYNFEKRVTKQN